MVDRQIRYTMKCLLREVKDVQRPCPATRERRAGPVAGVVLSVLATGLAACAGSSDIVVAHVGNATITASEVRHQMALLYAEGRAGPSQRIREQALQDLISREWLAGELARERITLSSSQIAQRAQDRQWSAAAYRPKASVPGMSDLRQMAVAELASELLRERAQHIPAPSPREVRDYYVRHRRQFLVPEERYIVITNRKHAREALQLKREIEQGRSSLAGASREWALRREARFASPLYAAVFGARPDVPTGPVKTRVDYSLFEVKRIVTAHYRSLAESVLEIEQRLAGDQRKNALAARVRRWRTWWSARTDCRAGNVVQKCRQYVGTRMPEATTSFT
jgi:hypothetical protein